jgi:hypothetical protein
MPLKSWTAWKTSEDAILRRVVPMDGFIAAQALLPMHSLRAVKLRAWRLGIKPSGDHCKWTNDELEILRTIYPIEGTSGCMLRLNRSLSTICKRVQMEGIKYLSKSKRGIEM